LNALITLQTVLWRDPVTLQLFEESSGYAKLGRMLERVEETVVTITAILPTRKPSSYHTPSAATTAGTTEDASLSQSAAAKIPSTPNNDKGDDGTPAKSSSSAATAAAALTRGSSVAAAAAPLRHYHPLTGSNAATETLRSGGRNNNNSTSTQQSEDSGYVGIEKGSRGIEAMDQGINEDDEVEVEVEEETVYDVLTPNQRTQYNDTVLTMIMALLIEEYVTYIPNFTQRHRDMNGESDEQLSPSSLSTDFSDVHLTPVSLPRGNSTSTSTSSSLSHFNALQLLAILAASSSSHLITVCVCASHALLTANPVNIVALELSGAVSKLCCTLAKMTLGDDEEMERRKATFQAVVRLKKREERRRRRHSEEAVHSPTTSIVDHTTQQKGVNHGEEESTTGAVLRTREENEIITHCPDLLTTPKKTKQWGTSKTNQQRQRCHPICCEKVVTVINSSYDDLPVILDITAVLQLAAVITSYRDQSIACFLTQLSLTLAMAVATGATRTSSSTAFSTASTAAFEIKNLGSAPASKASISASTIRRRKAKLNAKARAIARGEAKSAIYEAAKDRLGWMKPQLCQHCETERAHFECLSDR
jgi:hypothetical protein